MKRSPRIGSIAGLIGLSFDPIRLRTEDERPLALRSEFPSSEAPKVLYLSRISFPLRATRRDLFYKPGDEWPANVKIEIQPGRLAAPMRPPYFLRECDLTHTRTGRSFATLGRSAMVRSSRPAKSQKADCGFPRSVCFLTQGHSASKGRGSGG